MASHTKPYLTQKMNHPVEGLRPQPGPQMIFLQSRADIAIFGGAAGGGKSFSLLLEPCYHISNAKFRAVIFRRTGPMLHAPGGLWDACRDIYPLVGGESREQAQEWTFASRAVIKFSGMELENDCYGWQGSEICLLCFDELQQFTEKQFFYLLSRNRSTCGVRPYVRATCNPDSDSWLRNFLSWWIHPDTGLPIPERAGVLRWFVRRDDAMEWGDIRELESFPVAKHDDQVDALSGAHSMLLHCSGPIAVAVPRGHSAREGFLGSSMRGGFNWPSDHPFRPRGRPLL